jgi:DNA invertase Pin-like site-specific DNA recombinase
MKGKKPNDLRGYKRMTVEQLREFPGLENLSENDLNVIGFFGGTYESAKTDERNEFNRMIRFVKNQKEGVSAILVYSLDRFSRTGDNAIFISSELKRQGISILSVTQPIALGSILKQISFVDRFRLCFIGPCHLH